MTKTILLTHTPDMRRNYYGERALAGLNALATVRFHESDAPLAGSSLIEAAAGCAVIVSDRQTPGDAAIFGALPNLVAFVRCAVDIRNVAVPAASANGVLVTHASAGFIASVAELVLGAMIDLGRHVTPAATTYHGGVAPTALRGIQLRGGACRRGFFKLSAIIVSPLYVSCAAAPNGSRGRHWRRPSAPCP